MLTDIFAYRYADRPIWTEFRETDRILLVQGFRMVSEQLFPPTADYVSSAVNTSAWNNIHSRLSMELGLERLEIQSPYESNPFMSSSQPQSTVSLCKTWMFAGTEHRQDVDVFMKQRISFIELAFRERMAVLASAESSHKLLESEHSKKNVAAENVFSEVLRSINNAQITVSRLDGEEIARKNATFADCGHELNERFRRAEIPLNYHNGYIQIESDPLVQSQIAAPFWMLISDPKWKNVEIDMMEAVDRSETAQRDPAFYAAKALESTIKIISDERGWTTGKEIGAGQYIDNFRKKANGSFIAEWEAAAIRHIFANVRNELGHGPGGEPMPVLTQQQTDWTIEAAMSWTKSLIRRL